MLATSKDYSVFMKTKIRETGNSADCFEIHLTWLSDNLCDNDDDERLTKEYIPSLNQEK